jgi:cysteine desulfurase
MPVRHVYLDHASTTPLLPEALDAMLPFLREHCATTSAMHQGGLFVRDAVNKARTQIAGLIKASDPEEIIFTSSGTESANLAVKGAAEANRRHGNHIITSAIEHPAVLRSIESLEANGFACTRVRVDAIGRIAPQAISEAITDKTILICVHHANYDIGTIQNIAEIASLAAEREISLFVDASQSGGWVAIDVSVPGISFLSLAPHRFYGPKGVGVLYRNRRSRLNPIIHGGVQEQGRRAGTENVAAIVGAGVAAEVALRDLNDRVTHTSKLQKQLWSGLQKETKFTHLNGAPPGPDRISQQLNISFEFVEGEGIMLMLDTRGIAIASGTACVSKALKPSPVLHAIGVDDSLARGAVIFSPGKDTSEADIEFAIKNTSAVVERLRGMSPGWDEFQRGLIPSKSGRSP